MENNYVSVITITFNNFEELQATLATLKKATCYQSVVINGGKCQQTKNFLQEHGIEGISEPDEGISDAFNKGIKFSKGNFIAFLNSGDDLIDETYYASAVNIFSTHPEVDFIYADIIFKHKIHGSLLVKPNYEIGKTPFPHPSLIVRKSVFDKIGGFDKKLKIAMDYDFMQRMLSSGCVGHYYQTHPVVQMDGMGVSSNHGLRGIGEREIVLKRYKQMTFGSYVYLKKLRLKTHARNILEKAHLIEHYDSLKKKFFKAQAE